MGDQAERDSPDAGQLMKKFEYLVYFSSPETEDPVAKSLVNYTRNE
jgi:hypothetical protein